MSEATVGPGTPQVKPEDYGFPVLQRGLYVPTRWLLKRMHWSRKTWNEWKDAGLRTQYPRTRVEHVLSDWVIDFLQAREEWNVPPNRRE